MPTTQEPHADPLAADESLHRRLFESLAQGVIYHDAAGHVISANPAAERILGLTLAQMRSRQPGTAWRVLREDLTDFPCEEYPSAVAQRTGREVRDAVMGVFNPREERYRWLRVHAIPLTRPGEARPEGTCVVFDDITDRRQVERALLEANERYGTLLNHIPDIAWLKDSDSRFVAVNDAFVGVLGVPRERVIGRTDFDFMPEDVARRFFQDDRAVLTGRIVTREETLVLGDGTQRTLECVKAPYRSASGEYAGTVGIARDVTARLQAERALRERERKLALVLDGSRDGFWDWNVATGEVHHSDRWCEMLGYAPGQVPPHIAGWESLVHPEDRDDVLALLQAHLDGRTESYSSEHRMRTADGGWLWIHDRGRATERDADGRVLRMSGTHTDITARKQIELALRRRDAVLEAVSISAELLLGCTQWETVTAEVLSWLGAATGADRVYLYSVDDDDCGETRATQRFEWVAEGIAPTGPDAPLAAEPLARAGFARWIAEFTDGRPIRGAVRELPASEQPLLRRHGVLSLALVPIRVGGRWWGFMGFDACRDEHDWTVAELDALRAAASTLAAAIRRSEAEAALRMREEGLRRAHKSEDVARLAAGVAHEFNNMLTVIQGHAMVLETQLGGDVETAESLSAIRSAAERSAVLARQLLAYGRRQAARPARIDLNDVVRSAQRVLAPALGADVELVTQLQASLPPLLADTTQLEQVLLNLATNARAAMPEGGRFTIETEAVDDAGDGRPRVRLVVSDTGCGMDERTLARAFEPFFTTRPAGQALGLGLPTVQTIVQQAGGSIDVSSGRGAGTTFVITLPAVAAEETVLPVAVPHAARHSGTVLLVEDDAAVRGLTRRLVEQLGYRAIVAGSGEEALALMEQRSEPIELVLTDVLMPGMTGIELAQRLRVQRPGLPVLLMSGYSEEALQDVSSQAAGLPVLLKPFTPAALAQKVREAAAPAAGAAPAPVD